MKYPKAESLIIFEDDDLIILNKPPLITSEQENAPGAKSLQDLVKPICPQVRLCHRLDRETSGVIVGAKNDATYRHMSIAFQKKQVKKEYHAIGTGVHNFKEELIDLPLAKQGTLKAIVDRGDGKLAQTIINSVEIFKHYTLVQAFPLTGRFHQIRIHLATKRCSLAGDALYGGKPLMLSQIKRKYKLSKNEEQELPVMSRAALHAFKVDFIHPNGKEISFEAPYSKDFEASVRLLRKYDSMM